MIYALFVAGSIYRDLCASLGDQPDHEFAVGGPQWILRAGDPGTNLEVLTNEKVN